jgi:hypothetical protein
MTNREIHETVRRIGLDEARELLDVAGVERYAAQSKHADATTRMETGDLDRMPLGLSLDLQQAQTQVHDLLVALAKKTRVSLDIDEYVTVEKPASIAREEADSMRRCGLVVQ